MLFLAGLGLKPNHLTLEALQAIKESNKVFAENYTSKYAQGTLAEIEKLVGKKISVFSREKIEQGMHEIFKKAKQKKVCLLFFGNPLTATTHVQILLDAKKFGVKTKIIEGISLTNALARTGLDEYRFGRIITIPEHEKNFEPASFYEFIEKNFNLGLHTLCLLDTGNGKKFMPTTRGLEILEKIEKKNHKNLLDKALVFLVAGLGSKNEKIFAGTIQSCKKKSFSVFPQSIIVCGKLTEKEKEALRELHGFKT